MSAMYRRNKGCFGKMPVAAHILDGIYFSTCPGNFFSQAALYFIELFQRFQTGILPFGGTLTDQPSKLIEIFRTIEGHKAMREAEARSDHEQKVNAANRINSAR